MKNFVIERMKRRKDFNSGLDMVKTVNEVVDFDEDFMALMDRTASSYSNDDEISYIINKTGYKYELIELILWQKYCYEMIHGLWRYDDEDCLSCGGSELLLKEIEDVDFAEKVVCQECGYEMIIGDRLLEPYNIVRDWLQYLNEKISFPFEAEICEYQEGGSILCQGDKLKVHKIEGEDDLYGVIVSVRKGRKKYSFPLVDLEPLNLDEKGKEALEDYKTWFANR
jgi:hypothetical protein